MLLFTVWVKAQLGGSYGYQILEKSAHARVAALGGVNISSGLHDPYMHMQNPSLLNLSLSGRASMSYHRYIADVGQFDGTYQWSILQNKPLGVGLKFLDYGLTESYDEAGNSLGWIYANDAVIRITHSHRVGNIKVGAAINGISSQFAQQRRWAAAVDMGATFVHPTQDFTYALVFRNLGAELYTNLPEKATLPWHILSAVSFKPKHMPVRFSFTYTYLNRWRVAYDDPNYVQGYDINNQPLTDRVDALDNFMRHWVAGLEFLLSSNFHFRASYNHKIRRELQLEQFGGPVGFAGGIWLRAKSIELSLSRSWHHASGGRYYFTLMVDVGRISKKITTKKAADSQPL